MICSYRDLGSPWSPGKGVTNNSPIRSVDLTAPHGLARRFSLPGRGRRCRPSSVTPKSTAGRYMRMLRNVSSGNSLWQGSLALFSCKNRRHFLSRVDVTGTIRPTASGDKQRLNLENSIRCCSCCGGWVPRLDSYSATFSELVEYQGQTGTIWLAILERITEEYSAFSRNREHLILINDTTLRRDIQSTILKVHGTANLLKVSVVDEQTKQNAHAPQAELEAAARMTRHRFDQLRHQIDQARDLRQRLASGHPR